MLLRKKELEKTTADKLAEFNSKLKQYRSLLSINNQTAFFSLKAQADQIGQQEITYTSPGFKKLLQLKVSGDVNNWVTNFQPDDAELFLEMVENSLTNCSAGSGIFRVKENWLRIDLNPTRFTEQNSIILNGILIDVTLLKEEQIELKSSLETSSDAALLLEESPVAWANVSNTHKLIEVNKAFTELTGFSQAELLKASSWKDLLTDKLFSAKHQELLQQSLQERNFNRFDTILINKNGDHLDVEIKVQPSSREDEDKYTMFISDITERTAMISKLKNSERELQNIISSLPEDILELDHNGRIKQVISFSGSDKFLPTTASEKASLHSIYPGTTADAILKSLQKCLKDGSNEQIGFTVNTKDKQFWYNAELSYKDKDSLLFIPEEITDNVELEMKYQMLLDKYKNSIEECPLAFLTINRDLQIEYLNNAAAELLDLNREKAVGKMISELASGKEDLIGKLKKVLQGNAITNIEQQIIDARENPISILNYSYPVKNKAGEVVKINSMWVDISDRKLIEKEFKLKKASLEKSVDENISELAGKLSWYEDYIKQQDRFALFKAELKKDKSPILFSNKILFKLLDSAVTDDLDQLLKKVPETLNQKIKNAIKQPAESMQVIDETISLTGNDSKWLRVHLTFPPPEKEKRIIQGIIFDVTDKVLLENELNKSLESIARSKEIIYDSAQPFAVLSNQNQLLNFNKAFCNMSGYSSDELSKLTWNDTIATADELEAEKKYFKQLSASKGSLTFKRTFLAKNGKKIETEIKAHSPGQDKSDIYLFFTDLTGLVQLNNQLDKELSKFNELLINYPVSALLLDAKNKVIQSLGNSLQEIPGFPAQAEGSELKELFSADTASLLLEFISNFRKAKKVNVIDIPLDQEAENWLEAELVELENDLLLLTFRDITERKVSSLLIEKEKNHFKTLFENTPLPVFILSPECKFTSANQEGLELLDYNLGDLLNLNLKEIELHKKNAPSAVEKLLKGEELINFEQTLKGRDGRNITVLHNAYIVKDNKNNITSIQSVFINITERKKKEDDLQLQLTGSVSEVQEKISDLNEKISNYDSFFRNADSFAVFRFTLKTSDLNELKIDLSSPSLGRLVDNHEIIVFNDMLKNVQQEEQDKMKISCREAIEKKISFNRIIPMTAQNNEYQRWINLSFDPVKDREGNFTANGFVSDVSEIKLAETKMHKSEQELKQIISATPHAFYTCSLSGNITQMNTAFREMFDLPDDKTLNWNDLISSDPENDAARKSALKSLKAGLPAEKYQLELVAKGKKKIIAELREAPLLQEGEPISIVGVVTDISQQQQIEAELHTMNNAARICDLPLLITDPELNIIFASQSTAELLGLEASQNFVGQQLTNYLRLGDLDAFQSQLKQVLLKVSIWQEELELLQKDNTVIRKLVTIKAFTGWQDKAFRVISIREISDSADLKNQLEFIREELETQKAKELKLMESRKLLEDTINIAGLGVWNWDINKNEIHCSEGFFKILGMEKPDKIIDLELFKQLLHPEQKIELSDFLETAENSAEEQDLKLKVIDPQGETRYLDLRTITYFANDKPVNLLGVVYQLPAIPVQAAELARATEQQEADLPTELVPEAVKEEMPSDTAMVTPAESSLDIHQLVITHLIDKQPDFSSKQKNVNILKDIEERAEIIQLMLQQAMSSKDPSIIVFQNFLQNLLQNFGKKMGAKKLISMRINAKKILLPIEQAIPCGLIVHELVSNSVKYAFPEKRRSFFESTIKIDMTSNNEEFLLTVSDNGVGLNKEFDFDTHSLTGLKLVKLWSTHQLKGSFDIEKDTKHGIAFLISFKAR